MYLHKQGPFHGLSQNGPIPSAVFIKPVKLLTRTVMNSFAMWFILFSFSCEVIVQSLLFVTGVVIELARSFNTGSLQPPTMASVLVAMASRGACIANIYTCPSRPRSHRGQLAANSPHVILHKSK